MNSTRGRASIVVLAASSLLADEAPENKIADHLKRDPPGYTPAKHMRLRYVIVRVPMQAMFQVLEADGGIDSDFWNARLDVWEKAGSFEILEPGYGGQCYDLEDEREFKLSEPQPYRGKVSVEACCESLVLQSIDPRIAGILRHASTDTNGTDLSTALDWPTPDFQTFKRPTVSLSQCHSRLTPFMR